MKNISGIAFAVLIVSAVVPQAAKANFFTQLQGISATDNTSSFEVLYTGTGSNQLSISNVTVNGNVGVGSTGKVAFTGPGTINGNLYFDASNSGGSQYTNTNGSNVGPGSVTYSDLTIATDLSDLQTLSVNLAGESGGTNTLTVNNVSAQTVTVGTGTGQVGKLDANGNWIVTVANIQDNAGQILTINTGTGFTAGQTVVFNVTGHPNMQGAIVLGAGLTPDQIVWNFSGTNAASLNNNASSYPTEYWQGIILDPLGAISLDNANILGRVYGGGSSNMQIVSGDTLTEPTDLTPEPSSFSFALIGFTLCGFGMTWLRKRQPAAAQLQASTKLLN